MLSPFSIGFRPGPKDGCIKRYYSPPRPRLLVERVGVEEDRLLDDERLELLERDGLVERLGEALRVERLGETLRVVERLGEALRVERLGV
jgi:hypothetical protein